MTPLDKLDQYAQGKLSPSDRKKVERMLAQLKASEKWNERVSEEHSHTPFMRKGLNNLFPGLGGLMNPIVNYALHGMDLQEEGARKLGDKVQDNTEGLPNWLRNGLATAAYMGGNMLDPIPGPNLGMVNFHGTPHKWAPEPDFPNGRPRLDKMGTGEGAQAYGWGFYSADSKDVAKGYRERLAYAPESDRELLKLSNGEELLLPVDEADVTKVNSLDEAKGLYAHNIEYYDPEEIFDLVDFGGFSKKVREWADGTDIKIVSRETVPVDTEGALYSIDIPDEDIAKYLDWDAPLSEQPESVRKAILGNSDFVEYAERIMERPAKDLEGKHILRMALGMSADGGAQIPEQAASEYLRSLGIPGLKFFDGSSRYRADTKPYLTNTDDGQWQARLWSVKNQRGVGKKFATKAKAEKWLQQEQEKLLTRNYVTWDQDVLNRSKVKK